jgi:hypothetical protein
MVRTGMVFAFQAQTIRLYAGPEGEPLHIFHTLDVTVRRPNRLLVIRNGDDRPGKARPGLSTLTDGPRQATTTACSIVPASG